MIRYTYNADGKVTAQYKNSNSSPYVTYTYDENGELTEKVNADTGLKYVYGENDQVSVYRTSDNTLIQSYTEVKTEENTETNTPEYTTVTENHFGNTYTSVVKDRSVSYTIGGNTAEYSYQTTETDDNEQLSADTVKYNDSVILSSAYTYDNGGNVLSKSYGENNSIVNTYDSKNRIISTSYAGKTYNYTYDTDSQLTGVSGNNYSASYAYDSRGNITSKTVNDETTTFTYANTGWKDQLVSVNGTELTYDANGNVLAYGSKEYSWNTGRHLESIVDGNNTYSYTYDENGIRTSKTVNGVTTYYNTRNGVIISQSDGTNTMYFQYDSNGAPLGFIYNGVQYFYITNQMNDVLAITDTSGTIVGNYEYDAWGTVTVADTEIAQQNPIRYRGYYYDNETGYYYLQSRYYDPSICRFINADIFEIASITKNVIAGTNLFSYCNNNSINYSDPNGTFRISVGCATVLLNAIILAISIICTYFAKVKSIKLVAKISSKFKKIFNQTVKKISKWISKNLARIIKKCFKVTIANYRINKAANQISWFINILIDLSPGAIIASLLDRVDRDGKSGTIYW